MVNKDSHILKTGSILHKVKEQYAFRALLSVCGKDHKKLQYRVLG